MTKWLLMLMLAASGAAMVGCEIEGKADDDGAKLEVDVDD